MQSEQINELAKALALAQKDMTLPKKNREVTVTLQGGGKGYKFEYTTLDAIIEHVRPALTANGLWFVQIIAHEEGKTFLDTSLVHASGQWLKSRAHIAYNAGGRAQEFGSALTYMRRYALSALLGIASEEDDDANVVDGNSYDKRDKPPANGNGTHTPLPEPAKRPVAAKPEDEAKKWVRDATAIVKGFTRIEDLRRWDDAQKTQDSLNLLKAVDIDLFDQINHTIADGFRRLNPLNA